ncbi:MAG: phospholipase [unclassified Hahellaceae]|nr:phospholipase [Hahellaceae bacterium]|tara:strand:- start:17398 stop:18516 length:1119 start_codon:yes stop_codon:yes gene_type:complete
MIKQGTDKLFSGLGGITAFSLLSFALVWTPVHAEDEASDGSGEDLEEVRQSDLNQLTVEASAAHQAEGELEDCAELKGNDLRLACYDRLAETFKTPVLDEVKRPRNAVDERLASEELLADNSFLMIPHRRNYILPYTYNDKPNELVSSPSREEVRLVEEYQRSEAKYQFSFKFQLLRNIFPEGMTAWAGYTQVGFWQIYNDPQSKPFRAIDHEPELYLRYRTSMNLFGYSSEFVTLGINHHSNGSSKPQSRSWNRVIASFFFNKENFTVGVRPWWRIPEDDEEDDNADIHQFLGYAEFLLAYKQGEQIFDIRLMNNMRGEENKTSVEVSYTFPFPGRLKGYLQYYNGYGETLIDYNHRNQRVGLGVLLTDLY